MKDRIIKQISPIESGWVFQFLQAHNTGAFSIGTMPITGQAIVQEPDEGTENGYYDTVDFLVLFEHAPELLSYITKNVASEHFLGVCEPGFRYTLEEVGPQIEALKRRLQKEAA
jgi:hypothetical protein